ncbi:hypothetical protein [Stappia sp. ICDLI1TA098]|jgi:hypothetical protein
MFLLLMSTVALGAALAGLVMIANRLLGGRLPRWLAPAVAGIGMFGFTVWMDYGWFDMTSGGLPPSMMVVGSYETSNPLQPWTLVRPKINRFAAVDLDTIEPNAKDPRFRRIRLSLFTRYEPVRHIVQIYDCESRRRIDLLPGETADPAAVADAAWAPVTDDPRAVAAVEAICSN